MFWLFVVLCNQGWLHRFKLVDIYRLYSPGKRLDVEAAFWNSNRYANHKAAEWPERKKKQTSEPEKKKGWQKYRIVKIGQRSSACVKAKQNHPSCGFVWCVSVTVLLSTIRHKRSEETRRRNKKENISKNEPDICKWTLYYLSFCYRKIERRLNKDNHQAFQ